MQNSTFFVSISIGDPHTESRFGLHVLLVSPSVPLDVLCRAAGFPRGETEVYLLLRAYLLTKGFSFVIIQILLILLGRLFGLVEPIAPLISLIAYIGEAAYNSIRLCYTIVLELFSSLFSIPVVLSPRLRCCTHHRWIYVPIKTCMGSLGRTHSCIFQLFGVSN